MYQAPRSRSRFFGFEETPAPEVLIDPKWATIGLIHRRGAEVKIPIGLTPFSIDSIAQRRKLGAARFPTHTHTHQAGLPKQHATERLEAWLRLALLQAGAALARRRTRLIRPGAGHVLQPRGSAASGGSGFAASEIRLNAKSEALRVGEIRGKKKKTSRSPPKKSSFFLRPREIPPVDPLTLLRLGVSRFLERGRGDSSYSGVPSNMNFFCEAIEDLKQGTLPRLRTLLS